MKLLIRALMSLLPFALGLAFIYDVGGARTDVLELMKEPSTSAISLQPRAASTPRARTLEGVRFDGRTYLLSAVPIEAKVLGPTLAKSVAYKNSTVSIRTVHGINASHAVAMRIVSNKPTTKVQPWLLAAVRPETPVSDPFNQ